MKSFEPFRLDAPNHCLWRREERVAIPPKAFDVLRYLVDHPGRLITSEELLEAVWPDTFVNPEILRKYILDIRKILGDRADKPLFIETVTKRGYRFLATVVEEGSPHPADQLPSPPPETAPEAATAAPEPETSAAKKSFLLLAVILLLAVTIAIVGYFWSTRKRINLSSSSDTSILVLPFVDMSPGKDQEYFSDGLTEELINNLAKVPGLKVVARSSAFQFKGKNQDLRNVGRQLRVANVLEGSVQREGNRVRITAELTKTQDGFQLWSETYDRDMSRIFATQDEIARSVTSALQLKLMSADYGPPAASSGTSDAAAYQAYQEGQYFFARGQDREDLYQALAYSDQAIKLDPGYAAAWAQRSQLLERLARVALIDNNDGFRRARENAEKAIALDPNLAAGYLSLALVQINHDWDWQDANASLKKAALLEPGSAAVIGYRAHLSRTLGLVEEAIALYKQAITLDPLRANYHLALGYELYLAGRYDEALPELDKAQELNPRLSALHLSRMRVLLAQGRPQEARAEIEQETGDWEKTSGEALVYFSLGRTDDSDAALKKLIASHQNDCAFQIAEVYAQRRDSQKAFQWLDRALEQRDPGSFELKTNPLMKYLRSEPHYAELLSKMGLPI